MSWTGFLTGRSKKTFLFAPNIPESSKYHIIDKDSSDALPSDAKQRTIVMLCVYGDYGSVVF